MNKLQRRKQRNVNQYNILITEQDPTIREQLAKDLHRSGYHVQELTDIAQIESTLTNEISVALLDFDSLEIDPLNSLDKIKNKYPSVEVIVLSSDRSSNLKMECVKNGAFWCLTKPFEREELMALIAKACIYRELQSENKILRSKMSIPETQGAFVGQSNFTSALLKKVEKLADVDSNVIITGPSGTGKTTLARYIHQKSGRANKPFISVSCAALPRDLLEGELFGHEKGAFTGAISSRPGSIELADGGTLFLDEIGDMPLELQPKLLTFLQDKSMKRLGGKKSVEIDVRIISATNRDLKQMCLDGTFREDLYYRLHVLPLELPPLVQRPEDILPLAKNYLDKMSERHGKGISLSLEASQALTHYTWPGNVRELENMLERAATFCSESVIALQDLTFEALHKDLHEKDFEFVGKTLDEIEKRAIEETLTACNGKKAEAAKMLGISTKGIYNKIKKYDLNG